MKRKLIVIISVLVVAVALIACGTAEEGSTSTNTGTGSNKPILKVGMEAGYAPFNWTQQNDSNGAVKISGSAEYAGGYDVQIAKKIANGLGMELEVVKVEWDGLLPALQSGVVDAIVAGMSPTAKRKESIDFSENYYTSDFVIVMKKGSPYEKAKKLADFKGAKITAQLNTTNFDVIDQIPDVQKQSAMDNFPAMRVAVETGVIDGYVAERPEAISAAAANKKFTYSNLEDGFKTDPENTAIAIGVRKNYELTEEMNKILNSISEDERQKLMEEAILKQPASLE